ncbi:unnamed protein product [Diamesa hyperborea]
MSIALRKFIGSQISEVTKCKNPYTKKHIAVSLELKRNGNDIELRLPLRAIKELKNDIQLVSSLRDSDNINDVQITNSEVKFVLNKDRIVSEVFKDPVNSRINQNPTNVIVEFSSPNIAKPFHVGHLRSTIIGNFVSNLLHATNNNVTKMNYLGDWGTQFGFLKVGIDMEKLSEEDIKKNPLECLFKAYVSAHSSTDPSIPILAREVFERMENEEDATEMKTWQNYRQYTLDELKIMYERLNVVFNQYEFESMYNRKKVQSVIEIMKEKNLLQEDKDGKMVVQVGERQVPIIKSDGTTLYLVRDIAAFIERHKQYNLDTIYYVVDNGQHDHFTALKSVASQLNYDGESCIQHVKFGRIKGMSTRKGSVVFLKDILNEARDLMHKKQQESQTTKVDLSKCGESIADILGVSAVITNDLKQRRQKDYDFDWNKTLQITGDSGVKLQYTHCRLYNLNRLCGVEEAKLLNLNLLTEPEAQNLIYEILKYSETILHCNDTLEACGLVNYLFGLCNTVSRAFKVLSVKNAPDELVGAQRLLLFNISRKILKHGLEIMGLKVLNEM